MTTICPAAGLSEPIDCLNASHVNRYTSYCAAFVVVIEPPPVNISTTTATSAARTPATTTAVATTTTSRPQPPKPNNYIALCADGMAWGYTDDNGTVGCIVCPPGYFCVNDSSRECQAGTFSDVAGATACEFCPVGTYSTDIGRVDICPICPTNYVCENATRIRACPQHTTTPQGSTNIIQCKICNIDLNSRTSLWRHTQTCIYPNELSNKDNLIEYLIKENQERLV